MPYHASLFSIIEDIKIQESGSSPGEPLHAVSYRLPRSTFAKVEAISRLSSNSRNWVVIQLLDAAYKSLLDAADLPPKCPKESDEYLAWLKAREYGGVFSVFAKRIDEELSVVEQELKAIDQANKGGEV
jgi:hypothetical protein